MLILDALRILNESVNSSVFVAQQYQATTSDKSDWQNSDRNCVGLSIGYYRL